jgi:hypothetical protein
MRVGSLAVRMAPQTSMDMLSLDDRAIQLRVPQGNLNLRVRRFRATGFIEVATPTGSIVIRQPGSYRISVDAAGDSALVAVRAGGQAEVFTARASVLVRDNEEAEFSGSRGRSSMQPRSSMNSIAGARTATERYDRVASTRYVSAEMTGYEDLDYYGEWRTVGDYGNVWVPKFRADGLGAVPRRSLGLDLAVGLDLGRRPAVGLCAVPLWPLGLA